jgi:periplasmic divalent cation tolerance protein
MKLHLVYMTAANEDQAKQIGKVLVEERLAACINILTPMTSLYWWNGKIQEDQETVLIAKTRESLVATLTARVKALHTYDCPCIVSFPLEKGSEEYFQWLQKETEPKVS